MMVTSSAPTPHHRSEVTSLLCYATLGYIQTPEHEAVARRKFANGQSRPISILHTAMLFRARIITVIIIVIASCVLLARLSAPPCPRPGPINWMSCATRESMSIRSELVGFASRLWHIFDSLARSHSNNIICCLFSARQRLAMFTVTTDKSPSPTSGWTT